MFATRDQENLVHKHQTTAANKPLNQNIRPLQPKTPGNHKTPFRASKNDENKILIPHGQKPLGGGGPSKLDKNAFVTPAAPRNRAPLGAKTTNVKAQAFKTPAPGQQTSKQENPTNKSSTTRRSARSKIKVASEPPQVITIENSVEDDEPEYGYAPAHIPDLPDSAFDFGYNDTFPQFRPENMFRGYQEVFFGSPKDKNGLSIRVQREETEWAAFQAEQEKKLAAQIAEQERAALRDPNDKVDTMIARGPKKLSIPRSTDSKVDTVKAKSAAAALSDSRFKPFSVADKHTASSRAKNITTDPISSTKTITAPSNVSRNTIGFPKARKPASIIPSGQQLKNEHAKQFTPKHKSQKDIDPKEFVELYGEPPEDSDMWFRLRREERFERQMKESDELEIDDLDLEVDDLANDFFETGFLSTTSRGMRNVSDDDDVFQLPLPLESDE